jgi:hypothetical protein
MSQQVNLFENGLVKSKDWFTLSFVAVIYLVAAVAMVYFYTGLASENEQLQGQRNQVVAQQDAMKKKVDEFSQRLVPIDNSKFEAELAKLKTRLEMQSQILSIFQQSISDKAYHLIDYMRALAGEQQSGLWLTGFKIEPGAKHVSLSGEALQTEDIPLYLDLLSGQKVFAGTQFSGLQFKQVELQKSAAQSTPAIAAAEVAPAVAPPAPPVSGKDTTSVTAPVGTTTAAAPVNVTAPVVSVPAKLQVYAFDVKGRELSDKAKPESTVSWDDFVSQTIQQPKAKQP